MKPSFRDWRIAKQTQNKISIVPNRVGATFTNEQQQILKEHFEKKGWWANYVTPTLIEIYGQSGCADISMDGAEGVRYEKQLDDKRKRGEEWQKKKVENSVIAQSKTSYKWIKEVFGDDINNANSILLSNFLEGNSKKFEGVTSYNWIYGIEKINAFTSDRKGIDWKKLKEAYQKYAREQGR